MTLPSEQLRAKATSSAACGERSSAEPVAPHSAVGLVMGRHEVTDLPGEDRGGDDRHAPQCNDTHRCPSCSLRTTITKMPTMQAASTTRSSIAAMDPPAAMSRALVTDHLSGTAAPQRLLLGPHSDSLRKAARTAIPLCD